MPTYVLIADHTPDLCPASNARTRAVAMERLNPEAASKAAEAIGLQTVFGPVHLDPSHRTICVFEAPTIEAVNKWTIDTGLFQWNTLEVSPITSTDEMMPIILSQPTIFD
jgi:hypothetical protein